MSSILIGDSEETNMYKLYTEDILKWAQEYDGDRFHACLCDPPYHLTSIVDRFGKNGSAPAQFGTDGVYSRHSSGFLGQKWDGGDVAFRPETWNAIGNCLFPGAYLLAFGGTRTQHRLISAIEDAGFLIFDLIAWVHGQGFPKSHNVSKQLDRKAGAEREITGVSNRGSGAQPNKLNNHSKGDTGIGYADGSGKEFAVTTPSTEMAKVWDGYGTALKPAMEIIVVARKPVEDTIANNCVKYGSGAINIDGCRVPTEENIPINKLEEWSGFGQKVKPDYEQEINNKGRWPANIIHDGSEEVVMEFPNTGNRIDNRTSCESGNSAIWGNENKVISKRPQDSGGSAARFFYCAKTSPSERNAGLEKNNHPTLKPIALTEYLAKLILPPVEYAPRRLLVPFSGAGSEMIGACRAGWDEIVGIELSPEYTEIAEARLKHWTSIPKQMEFK